MTNNVHYLIVKEKNKREISYFEYDKLRGFNMASHNKNIKLKDAINVNKMIIINPSFVEKLINKRINLRMKKLLDILATIYDDDGDDPGAAIIMALNEVEKFKREMINKYMEYMTREQLRLLDKKIKILEQDVTTRAYYLNEQRLKEEEEYETKKSK